MRPSTSSERLVEMANDIAAFFAVEPDREVALRGIASHIERFWEPRMRERLLAHAAAGGDGLDALVREAVARLSAPGAAPAATGPRPG